MGKMNFDIGAAWGLLSFCRRLHFAYGNLLRPREITKIGKMAFVQSMRNKKTAARKSRRFAYKKSSPMGILKSKS